MLKKFTAYFLLVVVLCCFSACETAGSKDEAKEPVQKKHMHVSGMIAGKTDSELILDSDLIVRGKVSDFHESKWSNPNWERGNEIRNILQTDVDILVDEVLYGECEDTITVRIDGGEDETTVMISEGEPEFEKDENVLLFLCRDDSDVKTDEDYYIVVGMLQGKFTLDNVSQASQEKNMSGINYKNIDNSFNTDELKAQIKKEHEENPNYREEKAIRQKEIEEQNKLLFGE